MSRQAQLTNRGKSKVYEHFLTQLNIDISQQKKILLLLPLLLLM